METLFVSLALCDRNAMVTGGISSQRDDTAERLCFFDISTDMRFNKQLIRRWFEAVWRACDTTIMQLIWELLFSVIQNNLYRPSFVEEYISLKG